MMLSMPISLGVAFIAIISNFPIAGWLNFMETSGLGLVFSEVLTASINMLAIYIIVTIAYQYAVAEGEKGIVVGIMSLSVFLMLMPQTIQVGEEQVSGLLSSNLGSNGIFVAMITSILVSKAYCFLSRKNIRLKLPDTVPPMVSDSLSPIFIALILFTGVAAIKYAVNLTSYGDIFVLVNTVVAKPIMYFGSSPWALIGVYSFINFMWFFGIHPAALSKAKRQVAAQVIVALDEEFSHIIYDTGKVIRNWR